MKNNRTYKLNYIKFYILLGLIFTISSCRPTKRLAEGDVFLTKNKIKIETKDDFDLSKDKLTSILKQKPNRRIFLIFRFNLGLYNAINPKIKDRKRKKKINRKEKKIKKLEAKIDLETTAKKKKRQRKRLKRTVKKDTLTWRDKWTDITGEPPVAIDSTLIEKSVDQLEIYLIKNGYYKNEISYEVKYSKFRFKKNRAKVVYTLEPKKPYTISCINYEINDPQLQSLWAPIQQQTKAKVGDRFSINQLDIDREKITEYLNNKGYYFFTKDYIKYEADSTLNNNNVDIYLNINPFSKTGPKDSTIVVSHKKYFLGQISIFTQYNSLNREYIPKDTLLYGKVPGYDGIEFYFDSILTINPSFLSHLLEIKEGETYQKTKVEITYKRLANLGIFDGVNIQFTPTTKNNRNILDCEIRLTPSKKQAFSIETTGTHREGSLGILLNTSYRHKNTFKRAEAFQFGINLGAEAQQAITQNSDNNIIEQFRFNTFEIGPEVSLNMHNLFPISKNWLTKSNEPSTIITAAFNFQKRPDYQRTITQIKYSGKFVENKKKGSSVFYDLFNISLIRIDKSELFENLLDSLNNQFLTASYNNHLISSFKVGWIKNTQKRKFQSHYFYSKISTEISGLIPQGLKIGKNNLDDNNGYQVFGITYSHYIKPEVDFRFYQRPNFTNTFAERFFVSVGVPLKNLNSLPFEKSLFSGGSNGIRAWEIRSLGPGSYRDTTNFISFTNLGELKLELNLEYRFKMTDMFEGAVFFDAGNIWLLNPDPLRPGANIELASLWKETAVGSGIGLRLDFDYFLIRFDLGVQLKDPLKIKGEQWAWEPKDEYRSYVSHYFPGTLSNSNFPRLNFNLGIGYPF